ncbi:MAG TPA: N-acetylmuramoyl-L-alanine amidase [Oceanospirillales bacterium]|nr:N-acetylmuramoyl-L-alanine amidase [Oceanospirillaceae bacterium]HBS41169.1 N-acetylmuramoyl-L-alanine amidase [Oceanospirillales bacterium]
MGKLRTASDIKRIVIHCAATPNGKKFTAEDIDRWHKERGFKREATIPFAPNYPAWQCCPPLAHIGYHYVIELDGRVVSGRPLLETGAHVQGHNADTIGICLVGTDQFTSEQWVALEALVYYLINRFGISEADVVGHRDLYDGKTCPGFDVAAWLERFSTPEQENILEAIE